MNSNNITKVYTCILILLVSLLCALIPLFPLYTISICAVILIPIMIYIFFKKPNLIVYTLIILCIFQNILAIVIAQKFGGTLMQGLILIKELLTYSALIIAFIFNIKKIKIISVDLFAFIFTVILSIYLIFPNDVSIFLKLVQFRQIITPIILYLLGRLLLINCTKFNKLLKFTVNLSVVTVIFGFIECFFLGDNFWTSLGIGSYLSYKGMDRYAFGLNGLPGNFYTFDYYSIIGIPLRRMVSFIADPTLLGQFLVLPICILLFTKIINGKKRILYIIILCLGLFLTLSKGGLFSLLIAFTYKLLKSKYRVLGQILLIITAFITYFILNNASMFSSLPAHISGLANNFKIAFYNPLGLGLGKSGNFSKLYSMQDDISSGESFIGVILGQLGVLTVIYILFLVYLIKNLKVKAITDINTKNIFIVFQATLIGTITSSFISESAISFISTGILFLFSGILVTNNSKTKLSTN